MPSSYRFRPCYVRRGFGVPRAHPLETAGSSHASTSPRAAPHCPGSRHSSSDCPPAGRCCQETCAHPLLSNSGAAFEKASWKKTHKRYQRWTLRLKSLRQGSPRHTATLGHAGTGKPAPVSGQKGSPSPTPSFPGSAGPRTGMLLLPEPRRGQGEPRHAPSAAGAAAGCPPPEIK